ncbi:MAG: hypothetical protein QNK23_12545 [Crocinitomicaceae bacterium]|nr:hypothetical protein [Crocinitomicaceae bacterium]
MTYAERLNVICTGLCKDEIDYFELSNTIKDYEDLVLELCDLDMEANEQREDIHFDNGKALGTTWAAHCIRDILRTKKFIKGLAKAIEDALESKNHPIHVMYAGTGPFATLALPLLAKYSHEEVCFTFIEINKPSFESMKKVIAKLGFEPSVVAYENVDATIYQYTGERTIDIVVSETMQRGLVREQQVPITMNLIPQLPADAVFIPEKIGLEICLMNHEKFHARTPTTKESDYVYRLGKFFESSVEWLGSNESVAKADNTYYFPEKTIELSKEKIRNFNQLVTFTDIQVYQDERIMVNESGLTSPMILEDLSSVEEDRHLTICYKVDAEPGIEYTLNS